MRYFFTDDGYLLTLDRSREMWSDGDLDFPDDHGFPVDFTGSPLAGAHLILVEDTSDPVLLEDPAQPD